MDRQTENARALRKNMTKEERRLWYDYLRSYPLRFMRQRPIDCYIADFYCAKAKLVVELDGGQHFAADVLRYDAQRDQVLATYGIDVLRIPNNEVLRNFSGVCEQIDLAVRSRTSDGSLCERELPPPPHGSPSKGELSAQRAD